MGKKRLSKRTGRRTKAGPKPRVPPPANPGQQPTDSADEPKGIPVVYVLWHPNCNIGEYLASEIYAWLRPGNSLGPHVYFRCLPAPESPKKGLPLDIPDVAPSDRSVVKVSDVDMLQIVLPLIDKHMIADAAWRHWLDRISRDRKFRSFIPIALDSTAFNIPGSLREVNFLRPTGAPDLDNPSASERQRLARSLLKQLTEALGRLMAGSESRANRHGGSLLHELAPTKLQVFLSHAKADGTSPARRIRDYIYSQTQLSAFYDENDIPIGSAFQSVLDRNLSSDASAALVAVRSERYAERPWCRRELSQFRRPFPDPNCPDGRQEREWARRWCMYPTLVVEAMHGGANTKGIPEFGNSPVIRWDKDVEEQEEQIVTTLLRDSMLASFNTSVARTINASPNRLILNWVPDPTTLLRLPPLQNGLAHEIVYPGQGLSGLELDILSEYFANVDFYSFEEVLS